jgi:methyl-accepting chemotaxis protein
LRDGKDELVKAAAKGWIDKLDRNLFERYGDVQAFSMSEPARSGDPERIKSFMNEMMGAYAPIYDLMIAVNLKGRAIAVNTVDSAGNAIDTSSVMNADFSEEPWFKAIVQDEIRSGQAHVQDLHYDEVVKKVYHSDGATMSFTSPIRDQKTGKVLGIWTNRMSWKNVVVAITVEETAGIKSERIPVVVPYLYNKNAQFMIHPKGEKVVLGEPDSEVKEEYEQIMKGPQVHHQASNTDLIEGNMVESYVPSKGYASYPGMGWIGSFQIPEADPQNTKNIQLIVLASVFLVLGNLAGMMAVRQISRRFSVAIDTLTSEAHTVEQTAGSISEASQGLAQATTEQASALQETAASVEEMSAMVKKNADNAQRSRDIASQSSKVAQQGKSLMNDTSEAMSEINESNQRIMSQIEESNRQIGEIVKVITEIGNKTKVINDIVFQTKLLSFNASVEAARAGEHGKGFAVVAEEVGNLAQMSGTAAKEISDMLSESIDKVERIVEETKQRVSGLVVEGKKKVERGSQLTERCAQILDEIVTNVGNVSVMAEEISTATDEQAHGITEINKAMGQLDQVTHENAAMSQQSATSANSLNQRAKQLLDVVSELRVVVHGSAGSEAASAVKGRQSPSHLGSQEQQVGQVLKFRTPALASTASKDEVPSEDDPRFKEI